MHGPLGGRRPIDEATNPQGRGEWFRSGRWLPGVGGGAIAGPLSIVLHELGHFGAYVACRFPDPVLRFSSASWTGSGEFERLWRAGDVEAAAAIAQPWQVGVGAAAGPAVSYLIAIACVFAVRRFGPGHLSLVLGLGLSAPLHGGAAFPVLAANLFGDGFRGNQDDVWAGWLAGIPSSLAVLPGLICLLLSYWFLVTAFPRDRRVQVLVPTLVGIVLGGFLWIPWPGPLVLP